MMPSSLLGYTKSYFHLPYGQTEEGIVKGRTKGKLLPSIQFQYDQQKKDRQIECNDRGE